MPAGDRVALADPWLWQTVDALLYMRRDVSLWSVTFCGGGYRSETSSRLWKNTLFLFVLEGLSLIYLAVNRTDVTKAIGARLAFFLMAGLALCLLFQLFQMFFTARRKKLERASMLEIGLLTALCVIFGLLLNLECFNTWVRWDAFDYFHTFDRLSACNIFQAGQNRLKICGHNSASYALLGLFVKSIFGLSSLNALYLCNMLVTAADIFFLYHIFKRLLPSCGMAMHALYATIIVCSPWVLGSVDNLSVEPMCACAVLMLICAILRRNYLLELFAAFIACNTKETGAPVVAAIVFSQFVFIELCGKLREKKKIHWLFYCLCFTIGILWLWGYRAANWHEAIQASTTAKPLMDGQELNQFGFSLLHIKDTLGTSFIVGFKWVFSILILVAAALRIAYMVRNKERFSALFASKGLWIIGIGLAAYLLEMYAYVTWNHYRYFITSSVLLSIVGLYCAHYIFKTVWKKPRIHYVFSLVLAALLFVQSFRTIDLLSMSVYPTISTGNASVVALPQHMETFIDPSFTDVVRGNRQVMYLDKTLDRAFSAMYTECGDESFKVLCSKEYVAKLDHVGSLFCIWGFGYTGRNPPMWGEWNSEGKYRYLTYDPKTIIDPSFILGDADLSQYLNEYEHVYYIEMPWGDTVLDALRERYPISFDKTIQYRGWVLNLYKVK